MAGSSITFPEKARRQDSSQPGEALSSPGVGIVKPRREGRGEKNTHGTAGLSSNVMCRNIERREPEAGTSPAQTRHLLAAC